MSSTRRELIISAITSLRQAQNSLQALVPSQSQNSPPDPYDEYSFALFEINLLVNRLSSGLSDDTTAKQSSLSLHSSQQTSENGSAAIIRKPLSTSTSNVPFPRSPAKIDKTPNESQQSSPRPLNQPKVQQGFPSEERKVSHNLPRQASTPMSSSEPYQSSLPVPTPAHPKRTPPLSNNQSMQSWESEAKTAVPSALPSLTPPPPQHQDNPNASLLTAAQSKTQDTSNAASAAASTQRQDSLPRFRTTWPCYISLTQPQQGSNVSLTQTYDFGKPKDQKPFVLRTMLVHAVGPAGTNRSIDIAPSISFQLGVVDDPTAWGRALDKTWSAHHKWNHFSITFPVSATPQPAAAIRNFSCRSGDGIRKGEVPGFLEKILLETYGAGYWDRLVCLEWDCKAALRGEAQPPKAYKELIRGGMREEVYAARSLFLKASERGGRVKVFVVEEPELGFTVPECWKGRGFVALCKGFGMVASMASR